MRYTTLKTFTLAGLLFMLAAVSVHAQSRTRVEADIPFEFSAGNKTLPAGEYIVTCVNPASDQKVLQLRSQDGRNSVLVQTRSAIGRMLDNAKLVFHRYGDQYYFAQAWTAADNIGMEAPQSKAERRLAKELAKTNGKPETVKILSRPATGVSSIHPSQ